MATQPAVSHPVTCGGGQPVISCISTTCCPDLFATGTQDGSVVVWNIGGPLKVFARIFLFKNSKN